MLGSSPAHISYSTDGESHDDVRRRSRLTTQCVEVAYSASQVVCLLQPVDWRIYITPAFVALSTLIAWLALRNTRSVAREKATLDLIEKTESTEHYRELSRTFSELRKGCGFGHLHNPQNEADKKTRRCVTDFLNHYELVSVGIRSNILDDDIYKAWMRSAFVRDWNAASSFIQRERWKRDENGKWDYYPSLFEAYQTMAESWSKDAICIDKLSGPPPSDEDVGPNDEALPDGPALDEDVVGPKA